MIFRKASGMGREPADGESVGARLPAVRVACHVFIEQLVAPNFRLQGTKAAPRNTARML